MRPSSRFGLIALAVLLVVAIGLYTAFWFVAAGRIKDGVVAWAESAKAQNLDLAWQDIAVGGYPFAFRIELREMRLHDTALNPAVELQAPVFEASAHPWAFRDWRLNATQGVTASLSSAEGPLGKIAAQEASGAVSVPASGGATIWLSLMQASAEASFDPGTRLAAAAAHAWLMFPAEPPREHGDRNVAFAADLRHLSVPAAPAPFAGAIDDAAFGVTVMGPIPAAPPRQAAEAWRQAGGTIELDRFHLAWGELRVNGSGTVALGNDLQPVAATSGSLAGYDQLLAALVAAGRMKANDARMARLALGMMAKPGPDGRPELATSFTIQNGDIYLGPAKIGRAPRIAWE